MKADFQIANRRPLKQRLKQELEENRLLETGKKN